MGCRLCVIDAASFWEQFDLAVVEAQNSRILLRLWNSTQKTRHVMLSKITTRRTSMGRQLRYMHAQKHFSAPLIRLERVSWTRPIIAKKILSSLLRIKKKSTPKINVKRFWRIRLHIRKTKRLDFGAFTAQCRLFHIRAEGQRLPCRMWRFVVTCRSYLCSCWNA